MKTMVAANIAPIPLLRCQETEMTSNKLRVCYTTNVDLFFCHHSWPLEKSSTSSGSCGTLLNKMFAKKQRLLQNFQEPFLPFVPYGNPIQNSWMVEKVGWQWHRLWAPCHQRKLSWIPESQWEYVLLGCWWGWTKSVIVPKVVKIIKPPDSYAATPFHTQHTFNRSSMKDPSSEACHMQVIEGCRHIPWHLPMDLWVLDICQNSIHGKFLKTQAGVIPMSYIGHKLSEATGSLLNSQLKWPSQQMLEDPLWMPCGCWL